MIRNEFVKTAASSEEVLNYLSPYLPSSSGAAGALGAATGATMGGLSGLIGGAAGGALNKNMPGDTAAARAGNVVGTVAPGAAIAGAAIGGLAGYAGQKAYEKKIENTVLRNLNKLSDQAKDQLMIMPPEQAIQYLLSI